MAGRKKTSNEDGAISALDGMRNPSEKEILQTVVQLIDAHADYVKVAGLLLERFGLLSDVLDAPPEILCETEGVSRRLAAALSTYPTVFRAYEEAKSRTRDRIIDTQSAYNAVRSKFLGRKTEIVVLLALDSRGYLKYIGVVSEGSVHSVPIYIRDIVRLCILYNADVVYIAHNHPSGNCTPSRQDLTATKEIELALSSIDVILSDHFIFTDEDYLSLRSSGILQKMRNEIAAFKSHIVS